MSHRTSVEVSERDKKEGGRNLFQATYKNVRSKIIFHSYFSFDSIWIQQLVHRRIAEWKHNSNKLVYERHFTAKCSLWLYTCYEGIYQGARGCYNLGNRRQTVFTTDRSKSLAGFTIEITNLRTFYQMNRFVRLGWEVSFSLSLSYTHTHTHTHTHIHTHTHTHTHTQATSGSTTTIKLKSVLHVKKAVCPRVFNRQ
jgi:hypothetical protein